MLQIINKTIEYGLYFLVFLLPVQTRWIIKPEASEYLTISLYGTDILLIGLLILFIVSLFLKQRITNQELRIKNYESRITNLKTLILNSKFLILIFIAGLILTAFVSVFFAPDKLIAVYKCGVFLLGIGLFWLIVCANYDKLKLILSFLAGIFFQACLGIWQFLTQSSFANKWLGMAAHSAGDLGVSVVETLQGGRWLRAYGGLDHPNILGGVLAVGLLLTIGLIVEDTRIQDTITKQITNYKLQITNKFKIQNPKFLNYILLCVLCFMLCGMFFTFSRGAWAGLLVGILIMLAALIIKKDLRGQKRLLKIILLSAVLIFILFNLFQDLVLTRLSQDARLEVKSNVERVESLRSAQQLIKNNWLRGVGIGNYIKYNANLQIYANTTNTNYANKDTYVQPAHNVFLLVWAEIGIFGLLFFIGLLLACSDCLETLFCHSRPLRRSFSPLRRVEDEASEASASGNPGVNSKNTKINKKLKKRRNTFIYFLVHTANSWIPNQVGNDRGVVFGHSQAKFSLLAAITAMFFVDHWWWSLHFGVLLFWLVLGLIFAIDRDNDKTYNENII